MKQNICEKMFRGFAGYKRETEGESKPNAAQDVMLGFGAAEDEDTIEPDRSEELSGAEICIRGAVINHRGCVRGNNEDNFYFNGIYMHRGKMDEGALETGESREPVQLYAVCDGMGGADSGEEASHHAVQELAQRRQDHLRMVDKEILTAVLRTVSDDIYREAVRRQQKSGTTIAMLLTHGKQALIANIGDSRIYRFRDRKLTQMSLDHSKVQRMISMGILTPEQARRDPGRHVITQYLGMPSEIRVSPHFASGADLQEEDVYLLCSDGLTDMLEDAQIEAVLREKRDPKAAAQELVNQALERGGRDNVTVMLLYIEKAG